MKNLYAYISEVLNHHFLDEKLLKHKRYLIAFGIIFITIWQSIYYFGKVQISSEYRRADATGFNHWWGQKFVYFYYYLDLFPLTTTEPDSLLDYSVEGAKKLIREKPLTLRTEWMHWARFGESARVWLYMPYAIFTNSAKNPDIIFTNYLLFTLSLMLLYIMFWMIKKPFLGILLVLILGNAPFMIYEIYCNNNVFGLMVVYAVILFIIHVGYIFGYFKSYYILMPLLSGVIFGVMNHIRVESLSMIISCVLLYVLYFDIKIYQRIFLTTVLFGIYFTTSFLIKEYFEKKIKETEQVVLLNGGIPFTGGKTIVHPYWHPLLCGLGDYDKKYNFKLHDTAVYNIILPILRKQTGKALKYPGKTIYEMGEYYDSLGWYYKKAETLPGYDSVAKQIFIEHITSDPLWYLGILTKRAYDFLMNVSPLAIVIWSKVLEIPFSGIFVLLVIGILLYLREYKWLVFILFTLPLGVSVILVYSAYNNSYQSAYHYFAAALLLYIIVGVFYKINIKAYFIAQSHKIKN